jgi:hypothetical protein
MLDWLKTPGVRPVLRSVAAGGAVTHEALDALPQGRTLAHVRSMLVAAGALPARDERITALEAWIARAIGQRADPGHRRVLHGYAVWHHLRRLRGRLDSRPASRDQVKNVRDHVTAAAAFLDWLEERGLTLAACTQADLDQWLAGTSAVLARSASFVRWAVSRRHASRLTAPATRWTGPSGPLDQDRRWADARRLLHDDAYPAADRVAGLLILLYAQKLNVITALTPSTSCIKTAAPSCAWAAARLCCPPRWTTSSPGSRRAARPAGAACSASLPPGYSRGAGPEGH